MRLAWWSWLWLPVLCSSGCDSADNCGPTDEWPTCNTGSSGGGNTPGASPEDEDARDDGDKEQSTGGPKRDGGKKPGPAYAIDAGAAVPPAADGESNLSGDAGLVDAANDASTSVLDAGSLLDASVFDAGWPRDAGASCTIESDGRDEGACFGVYCSTAASDLALRAGPAGACLRDAELALACDGELSRAVARCAQEDILSLGFGRTVALCAGRAAALSHASEACIDCYVDEVLCSLEKCLVPCLSGDTDACTECRLASCGVDFRACSGLPRPR